MFDDVGKALDTASQMLAGGPAGGGGAGDASAKAPKYIKGVDIDKDDTGLGSATTKNRDNTRDTPLITEFIHFDRVHLSHTNCFSHPDYKDAEEVPDFDKNARPRAIQFRAALEREAILLSGFMQATQTVLEEREKDKGLLGSAMGAIGNIAGIGGGGGGGGAPASASDVNPFLKKVSTAVNKLNATPIEYKITHKTGMDFHEARSDYRAFLEKLVKEKPASDPASSMLSSLPGISSIAGPIGDVIAVAQGIAFKAQDIRVKFFARVASQQEAQVETACHNMTLAAIAEKMNPFLPVWFAKKPAAPAEDAPKTYSDDILGKAEKAKDEVAKDVKDGAKDVKDFFESPNADAPGDPFLSLAFNPAVPKDKSDPMPMELGDLARKAFEEALGKNLPGFVEGIVKTIVGISLDLLHGALQAVLHRDSGQPILGEQLYAGARHRMLQRVVNLALDKVSFLKAAKDFEVTLPMGMAIKPGNLADKGIAKIEELVNEKIGAYLDMPLKYAMGNFADQLELARQQGVKEKCHTMECYLGRLPWMQATLFCNLFFPFWDALMDVLTGVLDGALAGPLNAIKGAAAKAKGIADTGRDALAKADAVKKKLEADQKALGDGISAADVIQGKTNVGKGYDDALNTTAKETKGPSIPEGKFEFTLKGRIDHGKADELKKSKYDEVPKSDLQWDGAQDPPPSPKDT